MKQSHFVAFVMVCASSVFGADTFNEKFSQGDSVTLIQAESVCVSVPSYHVVRVAPKGETFRVERYDASAHKVYVMIQTAQGNDEAWIKDSSLTVATKPASELGGFLGIKWGSSVEDAKKAMLAREGTTFDAEQSKDDTLVFVGGNVSEHKVEFITLNFVEGGFYEGSVFFKNEGTLFNDLYTALQKKYGNSSDGEGQYFRAWFFPNYDEKRESLTLLISGNKVTISYFVPALEEKAKKLKDAKLSTKDL